MSKNNQQPLFELTRGESVESVHFGSIAISDNQGHLVAWYGDPDSNTFLRSSAKPFQAIPFIEENGVSLFDLSLEELMNIEIVSASKKAESSFQSPLSSTVLTKDEILASGATTIEEARRVISLDACMNCGQCSLHCSVEPINRVMGNPDILPSHKLGSLKKYVRKKLGDTPLARKSI